MVSVGWFLVTTLALLSMANASQTRKIPYITDLCYSEYKRIDFVHAMCNDKTRFKKVFTRGELKTACILLVNVLMKGRNNFVLKGKEWNTLTCRCRNAGRYYEYLSEVLGNAAISSEECANFFHQHPGFAPVTGVHADKRRFRANLLCGNRKFDRDSPSTYYSQYTALCKIYDQQVVAEEFEQLCTREGKLQPLDIVKCMMKRDQSDVEFKHLLDSLIQKIPEERVRNVMSKLESSLSGDKRGFAEFMFSLCEVMNKRSHVESFMYVLSQHFDGDHAVIFKYAVLCNANAFVFHLFMNSYSTPFSHWINLTNMEKLLFRRGLCTQLEIYTVHRFRPKQDSAEIVNLLGSALSRFIILEAPETVCINGNNDSRFRIDDLPNEVLFKILELSFVDDFLSALYVFPAVCKLWNLILPNIEDLIRFVPKLSILFATAFLYYGVEEIVNFIPFKHFIKTVPECIAIYDRLAVGYKQEQYKHLEPNVQNVMSFCDLCMDTVMLDKYSTWNGFAFPSTFSSEQVSDSLRILLERKARLKAWTVPACNQLIKLGILAKTAGKYEENIGWHNSVFVPLFLEHLGKPGCEEVVEFLLSHLDCTHWMFFDWAICNIKDWPRKLVGELIIERLKNRVEWSIDLKDAWFQECVQMALIGHPSTGELLVPPTEGLTFFTFADLIIEQVFKMHFPASNP